MPIVQISRIQHRRGKSTDLPQLAAGELGWVIDEQRLYIGNGTVADGAPAVGNTEILTSGSSAFSTALKYVYKGYLGDATPIITGDGIDVVRTLQERLDDYVSVKAFGAKGDGSTNDIEAIQRALDELYCDTDKNNTRSRRLLFFPAGQYNIDDSIYIPPYAQLIGEGVDKTIIYQSGGNTAVAKMQDNAKNKGASIGNASAVTPTNINIENITFKNGEAYSGFEIERATNIRFSNCKFQGTYASGGSDNPNSQAITVKSTNSLPCSSIIFDSCQFTKFARLIDFSYDVTSVKFINCDFSTAYWGAYMGENTDGATNGLVHGPSNIQFLYSTWSNIGRSAIKADGTGTIKNIVSMGNWFSADVGNNFEEYDTNDYNDIYPAINFDADECVSHSDYFERESLRSTTIAPSSEVEGVAITGKPTKFIALTAGTTDSTGIRIKSVQAGRAMSIKYKIRRGSDIRTGTLTVVGQEGTTPTYNDDYEETADIGVTLSVATDDLDSTNTPGNETFIVNYTATCGDSSESYMTYQTTIIA